MGWPSRSMVQITRNSSWLRATEKSVSRRMAATLRTHPLSISREPSTACSASTLAKLLIHIHLLAIDDPLAHVAPPG